jgi:hypothetical protein
MSASQMHDDEIRARLGMPIERDRDYEGPIEAIRGSMEDRIEALAVRSMPEPFDPEVDTEMELNEMVERGMD